MGDGRTRIEQVVAIGATRRITGRAAARDLYPLTVIPRLDPPTAGGFEHRRDRGRYLEHLDALRVVVRSRAAAALVCEGTAPGSTMVAAIDGATSRLPPGWSIVFADRRSGRWHPKCSPRLYVVSRLGAPEVLAHLEGVLGQPREGGLGTDALSDAFESFVRRGDHVRV